MLTSLPGATPQKPGSATLPFFGVTPCVLDDKDNELEGPCEGILALKQGWPSTMRTIYGDHDRYESTCSFVETFSVLSIFHDIRSVPFSALFLSLVTTFFFSKISHVFHKIRLLSVRIWFFDVSFAFSCEIDTFAFLLDTLLSM